MSIDDIKDVKKLRIILKEVLQENKRLKEYCQLTGEELVKNLDYDWDEKPKNLVLYASALNEKYENTRRERNRYKRKIRKMKNATLEQVAENNLKQEKVKTEDSLFMKPECSPCVHDCLFKDIEPDFCADYKMALSIYLRKFFGELCAGTKNLLNRKEK